MERLIPISRKQRDAFNAQLDAIKAAQARLQVIAQTLVDSVEEELPNAEATGVRCVDGVYSLVLNLPDPPAQAEAP